MEVIGAIIVYVLFIVGYYKLKSYILKEIFKVYITAWNIFLADLLSYLLILVGLFALGLLFGGIGSLLIN